MPISRNTPADQLFVGYGGRGRPAGRNARIGVLARLDPIPWGTSRQGIAPGNKAVDYRLFTLGRLKETWVKITELGHRPDLPDNPEVPCAKRPGLQPLFFPPPSQ